MAIYQSPKNRLHRDFFYLNDEVAINSLSALESGKVDEIVSRTTTAREGGFSGEVKIPVVDLGVGASKKASSEIEEEMVRTRTRFSIFDAWYQLLHEKKAVGAFDGWGEGALEGVEPGDTIEFRAELSQGPLQTVLRLFLWFADQATRDGNLFSQKGEELKTTANSSKSIRQLLGDASDDDDEVPLLATPVGQPGPSVLLSVSKKWLIGRMGQLGGTFGIVGQVVQIVEAGEEYPVLRLTKDVSPTPLEIDTLKDAVQHFVEPAKGLGVEVEASESVVQGPVLVIKPIAIYR
ncbi:hypothetical protein CQ017_06605 [Arthrobacter sp. MYb224]|uniref:DUF6414 family protein n=1 Tax=Arthrobacter sp. MYb224 TaxID=1848600 RepID=UPI000CFAB5B6|nr:hypothetical protein [Arthrobacter sp. MYb224]PQZ99345.1 hypothetical protein CQ017_06605 [Arthrobacter sp. MYb224]